MLPGHRDSGALWHCLLLQAHSKKGTTNWNIFKWWRIFTCCPRQSSANIHLHVKLPSGALPPPGHLLYVQQAPSQNWQHIYASLFCLSENKKLFLLPQGLCVKASVSQGKSHSLTKYCSKPVQSLSLNTSRETLFLEITQSNLPWVQCSAPPGKKLPIAPEVWIKAFAKWITVHQGNETFPSSPPPCHCTLNCSQPSHCFKLQLLPARLPKTWKSQACGHGEPDRKWHCAAFHGNHT